VNNIVFQLDGFLEQKINLPGKQNIEKKNIEKQVWKTLLCEHANNFICQQRPFYKWLNKFTLRNY